MNESKSPAPSASRLSPSVPSPEEIANQIVRFVERKRNPYMAPEVPAQLYREEIAAAIRADREHRHRGIVWPSQTDFYAEINKMRSDDKSGLLHEPIAFIAKQVERWLRTEVECLNPELLKTTNIEKISTSPVVQSDKGDNDGK